MPLLSSPRSSVVVAPPPTIPARRPVVSGDVFRDVVEILQLCDKSSVVVVEIIGGDLGQAKQVVSELAEQLPTDTVVGRIDRSRIGIVLPQMTSQEVRSIITMAQSEDKLENCEFQIWSSERRPQVQPVFAMYAKRCPLWKRAIDVVGACVILALSSPALLASAIAIKLSSKGPVVFKQRRVGRGGREFLMYKLRTMRADAEALRSELDTQNESSGLAFKIKNDPRITTVGKWLRKLSIDELPQLWNVVRGEMSLVGPRPLPVSDWQPIVSWHCRRHDVLPGLTGIWQVSGRCEVDFDAWVEMDLEYIRRQSLLLDCSLLLKTVPAVLLRTGAA